AVRLESSLSSFIRSTIDTCQLYFSGWAAAIWPTIALTSSSVSALPVAGAPPAVAVPLGAGGGVAGAVGLPVAAEVGRGCLKIADMMFPKTLMVTFSPGCNRGPRVAVSSRGEGHVTVFDLRRSTGLFPDQPDEEQRDHRADDRIDDRGDDAAADGDSDQRQ